MNSLTIQNLLVAELTDEEYDLQVAALGYERRATAVSERLRNRGNNRIAAGFNHNKVLSYDRNLRWFKRNGFEVYEDLSLPDFEAAVRRSVATIEGSEPRILVDISCLDRARLASLVDILSRPSESKQFNVDFVYNIAQFRPPTPDAGRNEVAGPVHRSFAGRFLDPGKPLAMIAGLGYELGKVMGAVEYLQAAKVIALFPESPIPEYEVQVLRANEVLISEISKKDLLRYDVENPRKMVATLDSVVRGLEDSYNVVLLPGGPKVFGLAALLAQRMHRSSSVWRVSSGAAITPGDVKPSGNFVACRVCFGPARPFHPAHAQEGQRFV